MVVPKVVPPETSDKVVEVPEPVEQSCSNATPISLVAPLKFIQRKDCSFGVDPNLSEEPGKFRAIESQSIAVVLPAIKELCSLSLKSMQAALHYDDYLFLTLNSRVIVSSEVKWLDLLDESNGFKTFDFLKLRDQKYDFVEKDPSYGTPFCYGDVDCQVPKHDEEDRLF